MGKSASKTTLTVPISENDHIKGAENGIITLVEYGDYECPLCGRAHKMINDLLEQYQDQVRFVFRAYPIRQLHAHAQMAAEAAEAAAAQNKFWEMHDLLFKNQNALEEQQLLQYAERAGVDIERFQQDLSAHTYASRVRDLYRSGVQSGVVGTPGFFINGKRYEDSWNIASVPSAIEVELKMLTTNAQ